MIMPVLTDASRAQGQRQYWQTPHPDVASKLDKHMKNFRSTGRKKVVNTLLAAAGSLLLGTAPQALATTDEQLSSPGRPQDNGSQLLPGASGPADSVRPPDATADGAAGSTPGATKILLKPGQPISINTETEDIQPTDDAELARKQAAAYPDSAEASFILAVALTRTSHVEEALKEVRHARRLAQTQGGADYFDKMIAAYEKMLETCPDDNRVRYSLAWAYYMKAYLLSQTNKAPGPGAAAAATAAPAPAAQPPKGKKIDADVANQVLSMLSPKLAQSVPNQGKVTSTELPHLPGALENAAPSVAPQVRKYYEAALRNLDDLLARKPDDVWAKVYRAHLYAEYSGDLAGAMTVWKECQRSSPQNPAAYFFLGEGYLKQGNLKECMANITRAIALRALGN